MKGMYFTFAHCAIQNEREGCYGIASAAWEQASLYANNPTNVEYAKGRAELNRHRQKIIDSEEAKRQKKEDKKIEKHSDINFQMASMETICE